MIPQFLGTDEWNSLTGILVTLWLFAFLTITFAMNLLIGHAILPSLALTRQLPFVVRLVRPIFYVIAAIALGFDVYVMLLLGSQLGLLQIIYPRQAI